MITEYDNYCLLCGSPNIEVHHLVFGRSQRKLADADDLTIPLCRKCHQELHTNRIAMGLSRICGQLAYEKKHSREDFRRRYGSSYL